MLTFSKYDPDYIENELVLIDPATVVSIVEARDRPPFSQSRKIAVITLANGTAVRVWDAARNVAPIILQARGDEPPAVKREDS